MWVCGFRFKTFKNFSEFLVSNNSSSRRTPCRLGHSFVLANLPAFSNQRCGVSYAQWMKYNLCRVLWFHGIPKLMVLLEDLHFIDSCACIECLHLDKGFIKQCRRLELFLLTPVLYLEISVELLEMSVRSRARCALQIWEVVDQGAF